MVLNGVCDHIVRGCINAVGYLVCETNKCAQAGNTLAFPQRYRRM